MYSFTNMPVGYTFSIKMTTGESKRVAEAVTGNTSSSPRLVRDILREMFSSDSPLAVNFREFMARKQRKAEKGGACEQ